MTDLSRGVYSGSKDSRRAISRAVTRREAAYLNQGMETDGTEPPFIRRDVPGT